MVGIVRIIQIKVTLVLCTLENPIEDCDDFATMWDRDDDYIDDDWIESEKKK